MKPLETPHFKFRRCQIFETIVYIHQINDGDKNTVVHQQLCQISSVDMEKLPVAMATQSTSRCGDSDTGAAMWHSGAHSELS